MFERSRFASEMLLDRIAVSEDSAHGFGQPEALREHPELRAVSVA
jgi:hypothetical protein